jgi:hypothetical protein
MDASSPLSLNLDYANFPTYTTHKTTPTPSQRHSQTSYYVITPQPTENPSPRKGNYINTTNKTTNQNMKSHGTYPTPYMIRSATASR